VEIRESQELHMENVLSFRGKVTQSQMQEEMVKIGELLQELKVQKDGPIATATYAVEQSNVGQVMDIEILVPLDRVVNLPQPYIVKPIIKLVNALYIRHRGNPSKLQDTINRLNAYILENKRQVITATYNVTVKDAMRQEELEQMIIDVYVGCNPCIV
jgi:effector-binding domain-containing protein